MMQTVTIDILNNKAEKLLQELELMQLIRVRRERNQPTTLINWAGNYKSSMEKQFSTRIDKPANKSSSEWE